MQIDQRMESAGDTAADPEMEEEAPRGAIADAQKLHSRPLDPTDQTHVRQVRWT
jgi:hypothetical protein